MSVGAANEEPIGLLEEALELVGDQDPGLRSELLVDLAHAFLEGRSDLASADRCSAEAVACSEHLRDPVARLWPLSVRIACLWGTARHAEQLDLFGRIDDVMSDLDHPEWVVEIGLHRARLGLQLGEPDVRAGLVPMIEELARTQKPGQLLAGTARPARR